MNHEHVRGVKGIDICSHCSVILFKVRIVDLKTSEILCVNSASSFYTLAPSEVT